MTNQVNDSYIEDQFHVKNQIGSHLIKYEQQYADFISKLTKSLQSTILRYYNIA